MSVTDTGPYSHAAWNGRSVLTADRRHVGLREKARAERFWTIRDAAEQLFNQRGYASSRAASASEGRIGRIPYHRPAMARPNIRQLELTSA